MTEPVCGNVDLVCIGNPLLDMSIHVSSADILNRYELKPDNVMEAEDRHKPLFDEVYSSQSVAFSPGGGAQNTARLFRWSLGEAAGVFFIGGLGRDKFGENLEQLVRDDGVCTRYIYSDSEPTGRSVNIIYGANRSLVADIGAANRCPAEHVLHSSNVTLIHRAKFVYIEGFLLTHDSATALAVARSLLGRSSSTPVPAGVATVPSLVLSLSGVYVCQRHSADICRLLPYVAYLFCHVTELKSLATSLGIQNDFSLTVEGRKMLLARATSLAQSAETTEGNDEIRTSYDCSQLCLVVTQSESPVLIISDNHLLHVPVPTIAAHQIVDTTAAGDAFVAGFLAARSQNKSLQQCAEFGIATSREIIQLVGCTIPNHPHPLS